MGEKQFLHTTVWDEGKKRKDFSSTISPTYLPTPNHRCCRWCIQEKVDSSNQIRMSHAWDIYQKNKSYY